MAQGQLLFLDAYKHLATSALDGKTGRELTAYEMGQGEGVQMLAAGRKYALFRHTSRDRDTVSIHDTATHQLEFSQEVPRNTDIAGPLFGDPETFMLRTFVGATDKNTAFIVHLRAGKLLGTVTTQGFKDSIRALPDGRLYSINSDTGRIAVAAADGAWRDIGALQVPPRLKIIDWRISHRGDKLAIAYGHNQDGGALRSDIWVANIDGSGQARLTSQWDMLYPRWSPDDRYIAFQFDTTSGLINPAGLGGAGLYGRCSYWYAPVEARDVTGIAYGKPHTMARQTYVHRNGRDMADTCTLLAWER